MATYRRIDLKQKIADAVVIDRIQAKDQTVRPHECQKFFERRLDELMLDYQFDRLDINEVDTVFTLLKEASKKGYSPMNLRPYRSFAQRYQWYF